MITTNLINSNWFLKFLLGTSVVYEEEKIAREDLARLCQKAENDANFWRLKYEQDGVAKIEELEYTKLKLQARFAKKYLNFYWFSRQK